MAPELERGPDASGHFGRFGGRFVPETLMSPLASLEAAYDEARADERFQADLERLRRDFCGRPGRAAWACLLYTSDAADD